MKPVAELYRAIHQGRWLDIKYENIKGDITYFWVAIKDIEPTTKKLTVDVYNLEKKDPFKTNYSILYERIISARLLENTHYDVPEQLLNAIESEPHQYGFIKSTKLARNVLTYYERMLVEDNLPIQKDFTLIEEIDLEVFKETGVYELNDAQFSDVVAFIKKTAKRALKKPLTSVTLGINRLSAKVKKNLFTLVYSRVALDIEKRALVLNQELLFNHSVTDEKQAAITLKHLVPMAEETFIALYHDNISQAREVVQASLLEREYLDERPYLLTLTREFKQNFRDQYHAIIEAYEQDRLSLPLKSFFGTLSRQHQRRKSLPILPLSNKVNLDQLRVMHNAMMQPVTFVQGPPGTGKTETILNCLVSAVHNQQSVLISSQNNHPINSIKEALLSLEHQGKPIYFPFLRLGNEHEVQKTLNEIKRNYEFYQVNSVKSTSEEQNFNVPFDQKILTATLSAYDEFDQLSEEKDALIALKERLDDFSSLRLDQDVERLNQGLAKLSLLDNETIVKTLGSHQEALHVYFAHFSYQAYSKFDLPKFYRFKELMILPEEHDTQGVKAFNRELIKEENLQALLEIFPVILTTNPSALRLGPPSAQFDLVVLDEASQCNPASALMPIIRARRLMLVGDSNQLQPITTVSNQVNRQLKAQYQVPAMYDYCEKSILNLMLETDTISRSILLKYHYRSVDPIIQFSNQKYYLNQLKVRTSKGHKDALKLIDVPAHFDSHRSTDEEVAKIVQEVESTPSRSVGVVTPFRAQAHKVREALLKINREDVTVGTVHSFQGDQKDKIIFSLGLTSHTHDKTFAWVQDNRELLNVAVTRARNELCVVGDLRQVSSRAPGSDLYELVKYIKKQGQYVLDEKASTQYHRATNRTKPLNTKFEEEFFETISHFVSANKQYTIQVKMRLADVIHKEDVAIELMDYYFKAHFDFVLYDKITKQALLAIELNGPSHLSHHQLMNDEKKKKIVEDSNSGLKLIIVPNNYIRRYETIRESIVTILRG